MLEGIRVIFDVNNTIAHIVVSIMRTHKRQAAGFTLIELMIVVAVVGILAAIAYPSYTEHIRKSRRAEVQSVLMDIGTREQQLLLDTRTFKDTTDACSTPILNVTPSASVCGNYTIKVSVTTSAPPTFTATATPKNAQTRDTCGTLTLTHTGAMSATGTGTCW